LTICLVTDRRRRDPIAQARQAVEAGIDLIQIRERDLEAGALAALVRAVVGVARAGATGGQGAPESKTTRVVVNDRLDVALACGADGVHLRGDSMAAAIVRLSTPQGFLVGRSVHTREQARDAGPVDYLIAGTVFRTESKQEDAPLIGLDGLTAIVRAASAPVLAIGGITVDRVGGVAATGAAGIAAIGLFAGAEPLTSLVEAARMRFDTAKSAP
jgi:thiamine-phosphate pyrophosphorylase